MRAIFGGIFYSLSTEPSPNRQLTDCAFSYLACSHSQLGYIQRWAARHGQVQDAQVLDFMLWCRDTLANVVLKQQALPELKIQQKQQEIK